MGNVFVNQDLEAAAKRTLTHLTGSEDTLKPLYLQPDRALFLAENLRIIFKVYLAGQALQHEYAIAQKAASIGVPIPEMLGFEAGPPAVLAMKQVLGHLLSSRTPFAAKEAMSQWQEQFETLRPLLVQRPVVLLHGDLQTAHILVDPQTEKVLAFLDFADTQPGDPLLDIAVVTLWDQELTDFLLEGYSGIAKTEETKQLLSLYRLLRHLAEIPWLLERGFEALAERNIAALKDSLRASHHSRALPRMREHASGESR